MRPNPLGTLSKERIVEPDNQTGDIQFAKHADPGRRVGGRDRSILDMRQSILNTVAQARGQLVDRTLQMKLKDLRIDPAALDKHLRELLDTQQDRCNLTGIPFHFAGEVSDQNLLPSADRIDSDGHYEPGNIQLVCRFVNFWKRNTPDAEFRRLLDLVRSGGDSEQVPKELDRDAVARDIPRNIALTSSKQN
jgi:hypothetical protein